MLPAGQTRAGDADCSRDRGTPEALPLGRWGSGEAALSAQLPAPGTLAVGWAPPSGPGSCGEPEVTRGLALAPAGGHRYHLERAAHLQRRPLGRRQRH